MDSHACCHFADQLAVGSIIAISLQHGKLVALGHNFSTVLFQSCDCWPYPVKLTVVQSVTRVPSPSICSHSQFSHPRSTNYVDKQKRGQHWSTQTTVRSKVKGEIPDRRS